eukprot:scaffold1085_cov407-Prasinococcus_capsulatus_cf.AAC.48
MEDSVSSLQTICARTLAEDGIGTAARAGFGYSAPTMGARAAAPVTGRLGKVEAMAAFAEGRGTPPEVGRAVTGGPVPAGVIAGKAAAPSVPWPCPHRREWPPRRRTRPTYAGRAHAPGATGRTHRRPAGWTHG